MGNTTALDYSAVAAHMQAIRSGMEDICRCIGVCQKATEDAQQKSSKMVWMDEFATIGNEASKQSIQVTDCVDDMLTALKKYNEQLEDFSNTHSGLDV